MVVVQSFSGGAATDYAHVFPVLWMTSCLHGSNGLEQETQKAYILTRWQHRGVY